MIDKITNHLDTIPRLLTHRVAQTPHAIAFMEKQSNAWKGISWQQFYGRAARLTRKFILSGVKPGDGLAILMANSIAWEIVQHAGFMAGCVVIGLDQKDPPERLARTIHMARIRVLAVQSPEILEKFPSDLLSSLKLGLVGNSLNTMEQHGRIKGFSNPEAGLERLFLVGKPRCATLLFTSGTTGAPKAISYDHDQLTEAVKAISLQIQDLPDQAHSACWLPLSSPFQRMINYCALLMNHQTFMVPDPATLMADVQEIAPHFMAAVPRFYEKIY
ncbi:MAG: AMP-binding protein, partial [Proteobacteria bacterium]|nr:AMP-binding protein [Pseudomonadota bacterium]